MRIMGIDYGDHNVGVAISDEGTSIATPLEVIRRLDEISIKKTIARIGKLIKQYEVGSIVLGYPKHMNNTEGIRCEKTILFKERLERNFKRVPVILEDERLSTVASMRGFGDGPESKAAAKAVDMMAAAYILQTYLDRENTNKRRIEMDNDKKNTSGFENEEDMDEEFDLITFVDDDGNEMELVVLDECEYNGSKYLLAVERESFDDDEADATILKCTGTDDDDELYEFVEDDAEFDAVSELFKNSGEDYDIE